jgi:hypothetical protein
VTDASDIEKLRRTGHEYAAYVVEACPGCRWHHLLRVLPVSGTRPSRSKAAQ